MHFFCAYVASMSSQMVRRIFVPAASCGRVCLLRATFNTRALCSLIIGKCYPCAWSFVAFNPASLPNVHALLCVSPWSGSRVHISAKEGTGDIPAHIVPGSPSLSVEHLQCGVDLLPR